MARTEVDTHIMRPELPLTSFLAKAKYAPGGQGSNLGCLIEETSCDLLANQALQLHERSHVRRSWQHANTFAIQAIVGHGSLHMGRHYRDDGFTKSSQARSGMWEVPGSDVGCFQHHLLSPGLGTLSRPVVFTDNALSLNNGVFFLQASPGCSVCSPVNYS